MELEEQIGEECTDKCRLYLRARCYRMLKGNRLEYRLCKVRRGDRTVGYAVGVRGLGESRTVFVGGDGLVAEKIYVSISRGKVTPCTLGYVVEDILHG